MKMEKRNANPGKYLMTLYLKTKKNISATKTVTVEGRIQINDNLIKMYV